MSSVEEVCRHAARHAKDIATEVLGYWKQVGAAEPWLRLPDHVDFDHLPELIESLAKSAGTKRLDRAVHGRPIEIALQHGEHRREEGFSEALLFREYHLLRRALWDHIRREHGKDESGFAAIMSIDAAITVATAASIRGFHRPELESANRWDQMVDKLLEEWGAPGDKG